MQVPDYEFSQPQPVPADSGRSPRCRDRGWSGWGDLVPVLLQCDSRVHLPPNALSGLQDKHKAPALPLSRPLSLQGGEMGMIDLAAARLVPRQVPNAHHVNKFDIMAQSLWLLLDRAARHVLPGKDQR